DAGHAQEFLFGISRDRCAGGIDGDEAAFGVEYVDGVGKILEDRAVAMLVLAQLLLDALLFRYVVKDRDRELDLSRVSEQRRRLDHGPALLSRAPLPESDRGLTTSGASKRLACGHLGEP